MLTVYALSMYACVTVNDFSGALISKTCQWLPNGGLWSTEAGCELEGKTQVGKPHYSDVADGSTYENYRCFSQSVPR